MLLDPLKNTSYLRYILYALDCAAIVIFLWVLLFLHDVPFTEFYTYLSIFTPIYCFTVFSAFNIYRSWYSLRLYREFVLIAKVWSTHVGLLLFLFFAFKVSLFYSRVVILIWFTLTPLLVFLLHVMARYGLRLIKKKGLKTSRAVIVGVNETGRSIVTTIETSAWSGTEVVGFFDDIEQGDAFSMPIIGRINELEGYLREHPVDYVYIALPMKAEAQIHHILSSCRSLGAELLLAPSMHFLQIYSSEMQLYGNLLLLSFTPRFHAKRIFDVAFSLFTLFCFLPFGLLIALLIKLEDGGPIFYGHRRISVRGKPFTCWKFRTMVIDADQKLADILCNDESARKEWERTFKLHNDPRVTRVGKFLRKSSLDEFPQFFNVIKGDMSVVGARPIVEDELSKYYHDNAGSYCSMRPGITGPWQTGSRSSTPDYSERVKLDVWYILNHSIWLDLKIIVKTIVSVFTGKGAC
jgi:putative colanic acid biosysnthesis UDP-glucose lipid carrier transferase